MKTIKVALAGAGAAVLQHALDDGRRPPPVVLADGGDA